MNPFSPSLFQAMLQRAVRPVAMRGLEMAGAALAADIRRRIAIEGPPRSAPGQPPHMDSGELHDSIVWEADPINMRVYVIADAPHAALVEYGTSRVAPRPFMRESLSGAAHTLLSRWVSTAFAAPGYPVDTSLQRR